MNIKAGLRPALIFIFPDYFNDTVRIIGCADQDFPRIKKRHLSVPFK
jgi:hypothetical protein